MADSKQIQLYLVFSYHRNQKDIDSDPELVMVCLDEKSATEIAHKHYRSESEYKIDGKFLYKKVIVNVYKCNSNEYMSDVYENNNIILTIGSLK